VIAKTAISTAIQSIVLMNNFTPQSESESASEFKSESENRHAGLELGRDIDLNCTSG
jgi:hypothetical protein